MKKTMMTMRFFKRFLFVCIVSFTCVILMIYRHHINVMMKIYYVCLFIAYNVGIIKTSIHFIDIKEINLILVYIQSINEMNIESLASTNNTIWWSNILWIENPPQKKSKLHPNAQIIHLIFFWMMYVSRKFRYSNTQFTRAHSHSHS